MRRLAIAAVASLTLGCIANHEMPWKLPKSEYGGAEPLNLSDWYTFNDYPDAAVKSREQGYVVFSFTIGTDGRMTDCNVTRSSGYPSLDAVPCSVIPARARFAPAKDETGAPIATRGTSSMVFWMPD